jgi:hypothetical protein
MMTDEQFELLRAEIRAGFSALHRLIEASAAPAARPAPGDVLKLKAAAEYIGFAPETLREGRAGTSTIPRYSDRPVQFLRGSLDDFKRKRIEREHVRLRGPARRKGLIRRSRKAN